MKAVVLKPRPESDFRGPLPHFLLSSGQLKYVLAFQETLVSLIEEKFRVFMAREDFWAFDLARGEN